MSQYTTPLESAFAMQRTVLKQGQQAMEQGLALQRDAGEMMLSGIESGERLQRRSVETAETAFADYSEAMGTAAPGTNARQLRESTDEGFARLKEAHAESFDQLEATIGQGLDSHEEFAAAYAETMDESLDELFEAHEAVEERMVEMVEQLQAQSESRPDGPGPVSN